jgi:hypothetical protein
MMGTSNIPLEVSVNPDNRGLFPGAISFKTGLTRAQAADPTLYAYEHHGAEFSATDPGALWSFYQDVMLGRPMPTKFMTRFLNVDVVVAVALFLHRDLLTHPSFLKIVSQVDFAHRLGAQGLAHIEPEVRNLVLALDEFVRPKEYIRENERAKRLTVAVEWVHDFTHGGTKVPPFHIPQPQIKTVGSNGFVVAATPKPLFRQMFTGWTRLYEQGYLRGLLYTSTAEHEPEKDDEPETGLRHMTASRKSMYVRFDLSKAAAILSEVETAAGNPKRWIAEELWLYSPWGGTVLSVDDVLEVLLRV